MCMRLSLWNKINKNFNFFLLNLSREWVRVGWMGRGHMSLWIIFLKYPLGIKPINPNGKREKKIHWWNVFCLSKTWKKGNKKILFSYFFSFLSRSYESIRLKANNIRQIQGINYGSNYCRGGSVEWRLKYGVCQLNKIHSFTPGCKVSLL